LLLESFKYNKSKNSFMPYSLKKKVDNPLVVLGFPGIGLVGTIVTKFLTDHLEVEHIGSIELPNLAPLIAVHKGDVIDPIAVYYNKKHNMIIVQSITDVAGNEWKIADSITQMCKDLNAKEIIAVEGMPSQDNNVDLYFHSTKSKVVGKAIPLTEGVIMGVTAALMDKQKEVPMTSLFVSAHPEMPDSEAASKVVKVLGDYVGINLDVSPLLDSAKRFESKLKGVMQEQQKKSNYQKRDDDETIDYLG
jgi:uncharacterized protein